MLSHILIYVESRVIPELCFDAITHADLRGVKGHT
jgi:hypothetical protein